MGTIVITAIITFILTVILVCSSMHYVYYCIFIMDRRLMDCKESHKLYRDYIYSKVDDAKMYIRFINGRVK